MRKVAAMLLVALFCAGPARAQSDQDSPNRHRFVKVLVGVGALAVGAAVAARSSETTTVSNSVGLPAEISSHSTSQLVTGLVRMLGCRPEHVGGLAGTAPHPMCGHRLLDHQAVE